MNPPIHMLAVAGLVALGLVAGCVSERDPAPTQVTTNLGASGPDATGDGGGDGSDDDGGGPGDAGGDGGGDVDACEEGLVETCIIDVGEQDGRKTCFAGERRCRDGRWGECRWTPGAPAEG